ncbi:hypothetical protein [Aeromonas sp. DNP9]|uniref:hypothetical protein n=1 Tax=Aeromonas sp. DNP9 TaxID=1535548 RepID=UPI00084A84DA|nr:hypothetical protein [Aeromonas sp. DNP9]OEC40421.1 hypothetical protein A9G06_19585 [Aeromonas sp. DNP9]
MKQHNNEPWSAVEVTKDEAQLIKIRASNGANIARLWIDVDNKHFSDEQRENARRIVACVNACRGLPTDELEQKGLVAAVGTQLLDLDESLTQARAHASTYKARAVKESSRAHELEQQHDELLAALEKLSGDVEALMKESGGVYGLHQNGEPAPWGELVAGGRHETWLLSLSDAAELIAKLKAGAA